MKRVIGAGFILLSGIILYTGLHISALNFMPNINSWSTSTRLEAALRETGGYGANIFAIILCILGFVIILYECYLREILAKIERGITQRNIEYENNNES